MDEKLQLGRPVVDERTLPAQKGELTTSLATTICQRIIVVGMTTEDLHGADGCRMPLHRPSKESCMETPVLQEVLNSVEPAHRLLHLPSSIFRL